MQDTQPTNVFGKLTGDGASRLFQGIMGQRQSEQVIYYRLSPTHPKHPSWVDFSDSQASKLLVNILARKWEPLMQYGIIDNDLLECQRAREKNEYRHPLWVGILNHPDGPREFPIEQILTFRWDDPDKLPEGVRRDIFFPQLVGQEIVRYDCPECTGTDFLKPLHLARHLINSHDYDRAAVIAFGAAMGINFEKEMTQGSVKRRVYGEGQQMGEAVQAGEPAAMRMARPTSVHVRPTFTETGALADIEFHGDLGDRDGEDLVHLVQESAGEPEMEPVSELLEGLGIPSEDESAQLRRELAELQEQLAATQRDAAEARAELAKPRSHRSPPKTAKRLTLSPEERKRRSEAMKLRNEQKKGIEAQPVSV